MPVETRLQKLQRRRQTRQQTRRQQQRQQQQQQQKQPEQPYWNLLAFDYELESMMNSDYEGSVTGLWNLILNNYFSPNERYIHRPVQNVEKGFVDIDTHQWVYPPPNSKGRTTLDKKPCRFLMTQCKRLKYEGWNSVWHKGENQLGRYMAEKRVWPHPIYGILAVGRLVLFYEWDPTLKKPVIHGQPSRKLHLEEEKKLIHRRLLHILNNHL